MRVEAELLGAAELGLGALEVAHAATNLTHLVEGGADVGHVEFGELRAGSPRFCFRLRPCALQFQQLGPVQSAEPRIERRLLRGGPLTADLGPFRRPLEIADLVAGGDEAAVDLPDDELAEPALGAEQHRLVEEGEALGGRSEGDQETSLALQRVGLDVGIAETPTDIDRASGFLEGELERAAPVRYLRLALEQHSVFRRLGLVLEEPLCSLEPPVRDRAAALEAVVVVEQDRGSGRMPRIAFGFEACVRTLAGGNALVELGPATMRRRRAPPRSERPRWWTTRAQRGTDTPRPSPGGRERCELARPADPVSLPLAHHLRQELWQVGALGRVRRSA